MERLAARVRASARDGGLIETAQVKLIGLDEVREAAGPRWPRMREYVREGSIKIIAEHIGPDDAVIACGDGFLVVFADATNERTQHRCTEIREALLGFYLGEEMLSALHADVQREATSAANLAGFVANTATRSAPCRTALMLGRFWPVWSARLQTVAAHLCAPAIEGKGGLPRMGYEPAFLETAAHCNTDFLDLDLCLLAQACAAAERPAAGPVGVSVHATTLQRRRSRQTYLDHVAANAGVIHQRMFITIAEIEPGTPLISLSEWASALVQTFSRIALDLHHSDRALTSLASAGIWAAGYHLPLTHAASELELRKSLTLLDSWCRTFRRQNILPFVSGFVHQGFLEMAHYSNLAFATGEAIWPSTIDPVSVNVARRETGRSACATS
jgi:hypothetical protein